MKRFINSLSAAIFAAMLLPACVDTHDDLPYVDPNVQHRQDAENQEQQQQEEGVFINETFTTALGGCKSASDGAAFVIDHSTAKITGYENSTYTPTTAYLVSPTIDLSAAGEAYYTFEHIIAYEKGDVFENEVFMVSTDYNGDATKATWTALPITAVPNAGKPDDWNAFTTATFNIPADYLKNGVTFAFRYKCTDKAAATWEIRNFKVVKGSATETAKYEKPTVKESSLENPLTVSEALATPTSDSEKSYVKGYIVGYVDGQKLEDGAKFTADGCTVESNILIADNANEKDIAKCVPVQLPASTKHRTSLNLKANPGIIGKEVVLGGYVQTYFGVNGLKTLFYSALDGKVIDAPVANSGFDGDDLTAEKLTELNIDFTKGISKFSIYTFNKTDEVAHVWNNDAQYGMKATANVNKVSYESKAWLISPSVDLSAYDKVEFYFDHAANYLSEGGAEADCAVYVSKDYQGGDPSQATWTKLTIPTWAKDWTFVDNTIDLTEYKGDNVHIAFEYTSTATNACTFETKNVYLGASRAAEAPVSGFDGANTVKTATLPFEYNFKTSASLGDFVVYDAKRFASKDEHIWTAGKYGATAIANAESESWFVSPIFTLESGKEYELKFTNWYKNAATPADVYKAYAIENFTGDLATATMTPLAMTFGNASANNIVIIDLTEYAGKSFVIGFQYTSTAEEKGTFEVIDISLKEKPKEAEQPVSGFDGANTVKTAALPFEYNFKTNLSLGDFVVYDAKRFASADEHIWTAGKYGATALANAESESWFISPIFTLESGKEYELKFTNWYKNAATPANVYKSYVVENFAGDLATATMTPLAMTFGNASKNNEVTIDCSQFAGKTFAVVFQYTSTAEEKGTFEVIDFSLKEKVADVPPTEPEDLTQGITTLTFDEFKSLEANSMAWVRGYIVGSYSNSKNVFGADGAHANTSVIISSNPNATDAAECIHVQLNTNDLKDNIGLGNVPANYGKEVIVYGKKVRYCGNDNSIKPPSYIIIVNDNQAFGTKPTE